MSEIKIVLPEKFLFTHTLAVRIYDINYGNHLGHDRLISLLHETRVAFLKKNNISEADPRCGLIMASLAVVYKNQAFYGDQLTISLGVNNITKTTFEFAYLVEKNNQLPVAIACTKMVMFDYQSQKIRKIPDFLLKIM